MHRFPALLAAILLAPPSAARPAEPAAGAPAGKPATSPPPSIPNFDAAAAEAGDHPPPPGAPADQALWRSAIDIGNDIVAERARAGRVQVRLKNGRYPQRLSALGKRDPASVERAQELRRRLDVAWEQNYTILTARWPVDPTRGCGYYALTFYGTLTAAGTPADQAALAQARADLRACLGKAMPPLRAMKESTDRLEAVEAEVDGALAAAGLGSPTGASAAEAGEGPTPAPSPPAAAR